MPGSFIVMKDCYSDSQLGSNFPPAQTYGQSGAWREQSQQRTSKRKLYIVFNANFCFNKLVKTFRVCAAACLKEELLTWKCTWTLFNTLLRLRLEPVRVPVFPLLLSTTSRASVTQWKLLASERKAGLECRQCVFSPSSLLCSK